jgi:hypothetical protein
VVHPTLDWSGTPSSRQPGGDRVQVALQPGGERAQPGQAVGVAADGGDPCRELLAAKVGEHLTEGPDVVGSRSEFRAPLQDRLQPQVLVLGETVGVAGEPAGHLWVPKTLSADVDLRLRIGG